MIGKKTFSGKIFFLRSAFLRNILFLITALLFCCLFTVCKDPGDLGDSGVNSSGKLKAPNMSVKSGLYPQPFSLEITASEGTSIYYSIDGSEPDPGKVNNTTVFKYSSPISVVNRSSPVQTNILATPANSENFYGRTDDPRGSMPGIYKPSNSQVPKATVIRAMASDSSGTRKSDIATVTYFIGNNLADYASHPVISLVSDPYNLVDEKYGILVRGSSINLWDPPNQYNFMQRGEAWERVAFMEIFDGNSGGRTVPVSTNVGIRVRGGWSRAAGQKSFNIYFRGQNGHLNTLTNYQLIPGAVKANGTPVGTYKSFMLRNGANDCEYTKYYDVFLQNLLKNRSFTAQAGVPCVVYINGEYWGPYNLQERYSDNATEYKYGVNRNNVISYDNGELDDGNPGEDSHYWDMVNYKDKDLSNPVIYTQFCGLADIQNLIDYYAAQIYIHNEDWPQNNYRLWRTRNIEPGNPYGDTKWRWQMFDVEFALGIYTGGSTPDPFPERILNNGHQNAQLFKALMKNSDFKRDFVNTMMDLYNNDFHPDVFENKLTEYANTYKPLMGDTSKGYFGRWGRPWDAVFQNKTDDARKYLRDIRSAMTANYLPLHFGAGEMLYVTISVNIPNASVKINSITPNLASGIWSGQYYKNYPVTLTAGKAPAGFEFDKWTVSGGTITDASAETASVTLTGNAVITANYKISGNTAEPVTGMTLNKSSVTLTTGNSETLNAIVTPSNASVKTVSWTSDNFNVAIVNNLGKVTAVSSGSAAITAKTLDGGFSAVCNVTVNPAVNSITLQPINDLIKGSSRKLIFSINPSNAPNQNVTWSSSNAGVASVSSNGYVTGMSTGTAVITVTTVDGGKTGTCNVTVIEPPVLSWNWYYYSDGTAVIQTNDYGNGEYMINVTKSSSDNWHATMSFNYSNGAVKDAKYKYSFDAKTGGGTRNNMYIQYYWADGYGSKGVSNITLNNNYQHFELSGEALPTSGGASLDFQCGTQTGQVYVKNVVITRIE